MTENEMRKWSVKAHSLPTFYYYVVPQLLFYGKYRALSANSRLLYGLIWDKTRIAVKHGWVDKKGDIYVRLARKTAAFKLCINSHHTIQNCYEQLEDVGLIYRVRNGKTIVDDVYPLIPDPEEATKVAFEQMQIVEKEEEAAFAAEPLDKSPKSPF